VAVAATARPFITHAGCRDASQLPASVRRSVGPGPSGFPVGHCFTPPATAPAPRLFSPRRSLFICARDGHFADGSRRTDARLPRAADRAGILLHYAGRACDERRQIAAGTRWINLLSISAQSHHLDVLVRRGRRRIAGRAHQHTRHHHHSSRPPPPPITGHLPPTDIWPRTPAPNKNYYRGHLPHLAQPYKWRKRRTCQENT